MSGVQVKPKKEKVLKPIWRGTFAKKPMPITMYRAAYSKKQAWMNMCREIAKSQGVPDSVVMKHYDFDSEENFEIKIEDTSIWK